MKRISLLVVVLMFAISSTVFALSIPKTHLVSVQWLAKNLNNPKLVIVDVRAPSAYKAGHIPHAVNIPFYKFFQIKFTDNLKYYVASPKQIISVLRSGEISNHSYVIFYTSNKKTKSFMLAARALWSAYYYGIKHIALLHGGIGAWKTSNKPISQNIFTPKESKFSIKHMRLNVMATWPDIDAAYSTGKFTLVDARTKLYYEGKDTDKRLVRHDHIPGAINVFVGNFSKKVGNYYELVSPEQAKSIFEKAGVDFKKPMITYCNIGLLASGDWFVAKFLADDKKVKVYDGSMAEYTRLMDRPIVKGD